MWFTNFTEVQTSKNHKKIFKNGKIKPLELLIVQRCTV